jgi:hypothetical protein
MLPGDRGRADDQIADGGPADERVAFAKLVRAGHPCFDER